MLRSNRQEVQVCDGRVAANRSSCRRALWLPTKITLSCQQLFP